MEEDTKIKSNKLIGKEVEIDLVSLLKLVWLKKWFIIKFVSISLIFGILIAFTTPNQYRSSTTLLVEASDGGGLDPSLSGLASLAGINLQTSTGTSGLNPALYQSIANTTPFFLEILKVKINPNGLPEMDLETYLMKYQSSSLVQKTIEIPKFIFDWIKSVIKNEQVGSFGTSNSSLVRLTDDQLLLIEYLRNQIFVEMNWDLGILVIRVDMQDPKVAAQLTNYIASYLTSYVISYSTNNNKKQLGFVEEELEKRIIEFTEKQNDLAKFRDQNKNMTTEIIRAEEERLSAAYQIAYNVYNQLAQQKESLKIQLNKEVPVFTVLEPPQIPLYQEYPIRMVTIALYTVIGVFIVLGIVFTKYLFNLFMITD